MTSLTLVLGGARSGKTQHAQDLAIASGLPVGYVATCPVRTDAEMDHRITRHRQSRPATFLTIEGQYDLGAIARQHQGHCLILDCLTLWLFVLSEQGLAEADILSQLAAGLEASQSVASWVIVSNEIGLGVVPASRETRAFRDLSGFAHQLVGRYADSVQLMVAGLPLKVK